MENDSNKEKNNMGNSITIGVIEFRVKSIIIYKYGHYLMI